MKFKDEISKLSKLNNRINEFKDKISNVVKNIGLPLENLYQISASRGNNGVNNRLFLTLCTGWILNNGLFIHCVQDGSQKNILFITLCTGWILKHGLFITLCTG